MSREQFPKDIEDAARTAAAEWFRAIGTEEHHFSDAIARAILAERERCIAMLPRFVDRITAEDMAVAIGGYK